VIRRLTACLTVLGLVAIGLMGCWPFPSDEGVDIVRSNRPREENPQVAKTELAQLVQGNREFAFDLFRELREEEGNLFFSPYSISVALAMAYAGARGATAEAMKETMHFTLEQERLHPAFNALALGLLRRADESDGEFRLTVANSSWGQRGHPFLADFLDVLSENYGAGVHLVDFAKNPEACRRAINNWVSEETNGKIREIIPPREISPVTRLVLANAIYLKALWPEPFDTELTVDRPFRLLDGREVMVPTMKGGALAPYARGEDYEAVWLRLSLASRCAVVIIVPDLGAYERVEARLDAEWVETLRASRKEHAVHLFLPKFSYGSRFQLADALSSLGLASAFISEADFSGMDGTRDLFISGVVHESFVAVDEFGIEAAGATAEVLAVSPPPAHPPLVELMIDRPFIFLIEDYTGTILFMGRVLNPQSN